MAARWLAIGGATASTYTLGDADVGAQISVQVRYTDGGGTAEGPLTSTPVGPVANVNDAPVGVPTISGTASKGQTLTADASGISDADGLGDVQLPMAARRRGDRRRDRQHLPPGQCRRRHADHGAGDLHRWSRHGRRTADLVPRRRSVTNVNDPPVGLPTISGTPTEDQTLTANTAGISDADGLGTFSYQWLRNGSTIGGATASTYTLGDADVGAQISVQVRYTDGGGTAEGPLTSTPVGPVANVNDAPVGVPTISGTASKEQTLTANTSGISDADGLGDVQLPMAARRRGDRRRDRQHVPAGRTPTSARRSRCR